MNRQRPSPPADARSRGSTLQRRTLLVGLAGLGGTIVLPRSGLARERVIGRRLELWRSYAATTQNLVATLTTTRDSSLYADGKSRSIPGTLVFVAPDRLLLHDDDPDGSTTLIDGPRASILANGEGAQSLPELRPNPALRWLGRLLVGAFAPPPSDPEAPTAFEIDARLSRPRGAGIRLTVAPPQGSPVRRVIRTVTFSLAPTSGAIERVEIIESAGDRLLLELSGLHKNLEAGPLAEALRSIDPRSA